jgi:hypothetical protein
MIHHTTDDIHQLIKAENNRATLLNACSAAINLEQEHLKKYDNFTDWKQEYYHAVLDSNDDNNFGAIFRYIYNASTIQRFNLIRLAIERIEHLDKLEDAASPRTRYFTNILPLKDG